MQFEVGKIYDGVVKGITAYGAFVEIDKNTTGMVHISEIANSYVNDIKEHLKENQTVKVKIIGVNEAGKISLSIKKAVDGDNADSGKNDSYGNENTAGGGDNYRTGYDASKCPPPSVWETKKQPSASEMSFEDMLNKFKQSSEEKIGELKRNIDNKRKGSSRRGR
jgi:S1 RNA binding domain protein